MDQLLLTVLQRVTTFTALPGSRTVKAIVEDPVSQHTTSFCTTVRSYIEKVRHEPTAESLWQLIGSAVAVHSGFTGSEGPFVPYLGVRLAFEITAATRMAGAQVDAEFRLECVAALRARANEIIPLVQMTLTRRRCLLTQQEWMLQREPVQVTSTDAESVGRRLAVETVAAIRLLDEGSICHAFLTSSGDDDYMAHFRQSIRFLQMHRQSSDRSFVADGLALLLGGSGGSTQYYLPPLWTARVRPLGTRQPAQTVAVDHLLLLQRWEPDVLILHPSAPHGFALIVIDETVTTAELASAEAQGIAVIANAGKEAMWRIASQLRTLPMPGLNTSGSCSACARQW
jgi:hypothetical protein